MENSEDYQKRKMYELELKLAELVNEQIKVEGLTPKEFSKKYGISFGVLKHAILANLKKPSCYNGLRFIFEVFEKLGYDLNFVVTKNAS
jgi:ribosomal protein L5